MVAALLCYAAFGVAIYVAVRCFPAPSRTRVRIAAVIDHAAVIFALAVGGRLVFPMLWAIFWFIGARAGVTARISLMGESLSRPASRSSTVPSLAIGSIGPCSGSLFLLFGLPLFPGCFDLVAGLLRELARQFRGDTQCLLHDFEGQQLVPRAPVGLRFDEPERLLVQPCQSSRKESLLEVLVELKGFTSIPLISLRYGCLVSIVFRKLKALTNLLGCEPCEPNWAANGKQ